MQKILYIITQSETGGAQRYIFDLAENLRKNFDVSVAFGPLRHSSSEASEQENKGGLAKRLDNIGVRHYATPHLKRAISPLNDLLAIFEIIKIIKKLKPNIIHLNSSKISILGGIAGAISKLLIVNCKLLIVYTVHGWVFNEPLPKWKKLFYKYAEKLTSYFKDKIICVSKLDYEIAKSQLKIPEQKLALIHHGIKPINFLSKDEAQQKLCSVMLEKAKRPIASREKRTNVNDEILSVASRGSAPSRMTGSITIGTIANLYKTKGLEYFIESFKLLQNELQATSYKLQAIVIGEGEERKNLKNLIAQNNLKNNFLLAGRLNAPELLKAFDIYVCSSVKEGFPYSILEAMQAELPIVSTNVGGIPEMIEDKKNGLLAEPQNPKNLAEKLKILIEDENLRKSLSAQAGTDAKEKFEIEKMIEKTRRIYSK